MLKFTKRTALFALATTCLTSIRSISADDRSRQFAGAVLQAIADGLNNPNTGVQPPAGGPVFYPPVTPQPGPGYFPVVPPVVNPNPVVWDSGVSVTGTGIDPWGRPVVQTGQSVATASAFDPNRGVVDPGSWRSSSSIVTDQFGNTYRETNNFWTSYGVPHSDTNRELVTQTSTGVSIDQQFVAKGARPGAGRQGRPQFQRQNSIPRHTRRH